MSFSISPSSDFAPGGTVVTITSTVPFFQANTTVLFGTQLATQVTFVDSQHITCVTPPNLPATYTVTFTTNS